MRHAFPLTRSIVWLIGAMMLVFDGRAMAADHVIDLTQAVVITPTAMSGPENKAIAMLQEEVEKRTQVRWRTSEQAPAGAYGSRPLIIVCPKSAKTTAPAPPAVNSNLTAPEGYEIQVEQSQGQI